MDTQPDRQRRGKEDEKGGGPPSPFPGARPTLRVRSKQVESVSFRHPPSPAWLLCLGPSCCPEPWPAGASHSPASFPIQIKTPLPSTQFSDSQTAPKEHLGNEAMPQPHPQRFWFCCPREGPGNRCSKKHSRWFEHAPGLGTTSKADSGWRLKTFDWISSHQGCRKLTGTYEQVSVEFRAAF